MISHQICNNCGGIYQTVYTDSQDDTTTLPDKKSSSTSSKNKIDTRSYRYQCPACGAVKPMVSYDEENELTYRAFQLLADAEFEKATAAFDEVLAKYPKNTEAYWGKVKAKYRVVYKKNKQSKAVPVCEKTVYGSVFKDENYQKAFLCADNRIKTFLKKQANAIDRIRGLKTKQAAITALASCLILCAGSFGAYQIFRHRHTFVTDPSIAPTCTASGITGKIYCYDCGEILRESEPLAALGHTPDTQSICTEAQICTVCGKELQSAHGHTPSKEATCTEAQICTVCNEELHPARGHTPSKEATCTEAQICTLCAEELTPASGHTFQWVIVTEPTETQNGFRVYRCAACGTESETETIPAGSVGLAYRVNADQLTCAITGIGTCTDTALYIPEAIDGYTVTEIDTMAFWNCTALTSVVIPDSVTSIGDKAFYMCRGLTDIIISDNIKDIGNYAFADCEGLTGIVIPDGVTSIPDHAFSGCTGLISAVLPDSVTSIGNTAFGGCEGLTNIVIPNGVTEICKGAFYYCTGLTSISIPNGVTEIRSYAFSGCKSLTSIVIPDGVTAIGTEAFSGCRGLTSIAIPDDVKSIGDSAFYYCENLTEIHYNGTTIQWTNLSKGSDWNDYAGDYTVYCIDGTISK